MSVAFRPAKSVFAFLLHAELDAYEAGFDRFTHGLLPLDACAALARQLEELRTLRAAFPAMAGDMAEVTICHTDLMHAAWGLSAVADDERAALLRRHRDAMASIRRKCLRELKID
jgi:hypothetical protein